MSAARKDQEATTQLLQDRQITLDAMAAASRRALPPELLQGTSARRLADCFHFKEPQGELLLKLTTALAVITGQSPCSADALLLCAIQSAWPCLVVKMALDLRRSLYHHDDCCHALHAGTCHPRSGNQVAAAQLTQVNLAVLPMCRQQARHCSSAQPARDGAADGSGQGHSSSCKGWFLPAHLDFGPPGSLQQPPQAARGAAEAGPRLVAETPNLSRSCHTNEAFWVTVLVSMRMQL